MERKLVTVRIVSNIEEIPNADKIVVATVDGWKCVVQKGDFSVGDYGVFFEIDSLLPVDDSRYAFLKDRCYVNNIAIGEGLRIRTCKLRKQLSQGLLIPFGQFPEIKEHKLDWDYSELLRVRKYEPYVSADMKAYVKGSFPTDLCPKTDAERIQNMPYIFQDNANDVFEVTEKIDGMSITIILGNGIRMCSRNLELKESENDTRWNYLKRSGLYKKLEDYKGNLALQGELYGCGINGNPYKGSDIEYAIFDIFDIDKHEYLSQEDRLDFCMHYQLKHVPILKSGKLNTISKDINKALSQAEVISCVGEVPMEGIVFKQLDDNSTHRICFKVLNNKRLLEE